MKLPDPQRHRFVIAFDTFAYWQTCPDAIIRDREQDVVEHVQCLHIALAQIAASVRGATYSIFTHMHTKTRGQIPLRIGINLTYAAEELESEALHEELVIRIDDMLCSTADILRSIDDLL